MQPSPNTQQQSPALTPTTIYHHPLPMTLHYIDYDRNLRHIGSNQTINTKIYSYGVKPNTSMIRLELQSDYDPFMNLQWQCDAAKYGYVSKQQGIEGGFQELATVMIKCFNQAKHDTESASSNANGQGKGNNSTTTNKVQISLTIQPDGKAKLTITQHAHYKNIQILALDLAPDTEENIEAKVGHRYAEIKRKVQLAEDKLQKVQQLIRDKNPTLLTQIVRGAARHNISG